MSSWYSKMYKSHEVARERNKREQRRLDFDRHGPSFVAKYQMSILDHEKKLVQRELERIRMGIHKPPKHSDTDKFKGSDVMRGFQNGDHSVNASPRKIDTGNSKEENKLYDAIIFLQNNPSALVPIVSAHGQSDAYFETLEKIAPAIQPADEAPYRPRYLRDKSQMDKTEKSVMLEKYKFLLQRHSPPRHMCNSPFLDPNRNSPLLSRKHGRFAHVRDSGRDSAASNDGGSTSSRKVEADDVHDAAVPDVETPDPTTSSRTRRATDLHELASGGMESARDNAQRRLVADQSAGKTAATDDKRGADKAPTATKAALFPSLDPDHYNPDGSLRTMHQMPDFKEMYAEAEKTRYVRTREQRECEKELSIQEIFTKK